MRGHQRVEGGLVRLGARGVEELRGLEEAAGHEVVLAQPRGRAQERRLADHRTLGQHARAVLERHRHRDLVGRQPGVEAGAERGRMPQAALLPQRTVERRVGGHHDEQVVGAVGVGPRFRLARAEEDDGAHGAAAGAGHPPRHRGDVRPGRARGGRARRPPLAASQAATPAPPRICRSRVTISWRRRFQEPSVVAVRGRIEGAEHFRSAVDPVHVPQEVDEAPAGPEPVRHHDVDGQRPLPQHDLETGGVEGLDFPVTRAVPLREDHDAVGLHARRLPQRAQGALAVLGIDHRGPEEAHAQRHRGHEAPVALAGDEPRDVGLHHEDGGRDVQQRLVVHHDVGRLLGRE